MFVCIDSNHHPLARATSVFFFVVFFVVVVSFTSNPTHSFLPVHADCKTAPDNVKRLMDDIRLWFRTYKVRKRKPPLLELRLPVFFVDFLSSFPGELFLTCIPPAIPLPFSLTQVPEGKGENQFALGGEWLSRDDSLHVIEECNTQWKTLKSRALAKANDSDSLRHFGESAARKGETEGVGRVTVMCKFV